MIAIIKLPDHNDPASIWRGTYIFIGLVIPIVIFLIWYYIRKAQKKDRIDSVKKSIERFSLSDSFWSEKEMRKLAINIFHLVMDAWSKGDSKKVAPFLTDQLKAEWREIWTNMHTNGYVFIYNQIFVQEVNIIAAQDFEDNSKDTFSVEISGHVRRYLQNTNTHTIIPKHGNELDEFIDIYTFIRTDKGWLLNGIHPRAKFKDIFKIPTS